MGGIDTNIEAETSVPGLYAAGECASASLNGSNRLGSNSLTECLVFGAKAGHNAVAYAKGTSGGNEASLRAQGEEEAARVESLRGQKKGGEKLAQIRIDLNQTMEEGCGVYRMEDTMQATVQEIKTLQARYDDVTLEDSSKIFNTEIIQAMELRNMLDVAEAVANAAAVRKESRGAHTRRDFTTRDDQNYLHHSLCYFDPAGPRLDKKEVTLGKWVPEERKY
jgi:fumarate reductase flavoprotein subunit